MLAVVVSCRAIAQLLRVSKRDRPWSKPFGPVGRVQHGCRVELHEFSVMTKGERMRAIATAALGFFLFISLPTPGFSQALGTITGVVKDSSGAVLPGATVEASSPALIEKTRTVVTDGSGQYRIVSLPTGVYTVTVTLQGFSRF